MRSRKATVVLITASVFLILVMGFLEWSSESYRPYADAVQWLLVATLLLVAREIVERLNRSESKLRALLGSLDELILILDRDGRYVEIGATNRSLLFKPLEQLTGKLIHDVFPKEVADEFVSEIRRALASDGPTSYDYVLSLDGRDVWFNGLITRLSDTTVMWVARDITERKMAEIELEKRVDERTRELRSSEERYRGVIEQAEEIIATVGADGMIKSLNPAFERILGWDRTQWIERPFFALVPAELRAVAGQLFAQLGQDGKIGPVRVTAVHQNGSRVAIELTARQKLAGGSESGFIAVMRDVTERERAQHALRLSERRLAEAQELAKLGSFDHDLTTHTLIWSEQLYRLLGLEPQDEPLPEAQMIEMVVPEDRAKIEEAQRAVAVKGEHEWEMRLRATDGTIKTTQCRGKLVIDSERSSIRIVGSVRDVTEEKHAEDLLKQSEERFRLATLATNDAIWDVDMTTNISWHSDAFRRFGYDGGMVGDGYQWWIDRIHPEDRDAIVARQREALETGQSSWSDEYRLRRADGTYASILDRTYIVRDANMKPTRILGAVLDMTERKQLIDQLEQAKRVSSLGRVAASIAHEFNNILMGIQPNVEAIQRSSPTGLRVMTENITRAVQRGKRVTDEILRFTRPSEPDLECVDTADFFAKWRNEIEPLLGPAVELVVELDSGPLHVAADPLQLAQIFTNLALNARDAMQESGGRLTISGHLSNSFGSFPFGVVKTPDRFVHFAVKDEGCGITSDRLAHIFEPLFTTKRGGIGLGLAITYQIVARHEGHIFVESEVGRGSTFHVFVPAALPEVAEPDEQVESHFSTIRKLVLVEDEPAVASGIAMLLEMEGISVCTVYTGRDSIPAIEEFQPDAVILDIGLPDMDGVGVYLEIARRWPDLAVLFSSGHGDSAKLEHYLAQPNVGFILKPYEFEAMRTALCRLVENKAEARAS